MSHSYYVGNQVICQATFTTAATGAAVDPTAVYFQFKNPSQVITTYQYGVGVEIQKLSTGIYTVTISIDNDGDWYYRWYSTGTGQAAAETRFNAKDSEFA